MTFEIGTTVVETVGFFRGSEFTVVGEYQGTSAKWGQRTLIAPELPPTPRIPRSLRILGTKPEYALFLEYLKTPDARTLLTLEAQCPEIDFAVRQQYRKITGEDLVEGDGYNVAPETAKKQGCEGAVTFIPPVVMPEDIREMMVQRSGLVNRIEFLWMLVENGFRVKR